MTEAFSPALAQKLARLLPRLASDFDGEVVATARALDRVLRAEGHDLRAMAKAVAEPRTVIVYEPEPPAAPSRPLTLLDIARMCRAHHGGRLNSKEQAFIADMLANLTLGRRPTERQEKWLRAIFYRIGGEYVP